MIEAVLSIAFVVHVLRIAVQYALAAIGGAITERAGVIDLAIEAKLLFGAFAAAAVAYATDSVVAGIAGGMLCGAVVASVQLWLALRFAADQVIVGVGLNILALGGTRFLLQVLFGESSNSPACPSLGDAVLTNPIVWLAIIAAITTPVAIAKLRWGLRLRAAGDRPAALVAVGASPVRSRVWAGLIGGALAGAGGAQLSLSNGGFVADMSSGRGYIALAMVILAGWRPAWAAVCCVGIAVAGALADKLQITGVGIPRELASILPYVLTLVVLAIGGVLRSPPRALGKLD
ncbi:MAG: ABC transporter permease [Kofleriaceae bacterium]